MSKIIHKKLDIQLGEPQIKELKDHYRQVIQHLEEGFPLKMKVLEALKSDLSNIVNNTPQWQEILQALHDNNDLYCIRLMHHDNEILNLPWSMAVDSKSNKQLGNIEKLYLTKSIHGCFDEKSTGFPKAPAPLKILIMISSPEDTEWKHRLSYEEEEYAILKAFEPLMHKGAVEVDFTEDGSLEALERKLKTNKYHILHFSGHATFREKDKTGYIQMEDPLSLKTRLAAAEDFANVVNCHPQHKVPMVMLSSCKTAQGSTEEGLRGITNHLLKVGVPVVISMGMAVNDYYAALFSAHFYKRLAEKQTIFSAFNAAIEHLRETEYNVLKNTPDSREIPLQWIIPNLYLSRDIEEVVDWNQTEEKLNFSTQHHYIFGQNRILLEHEKDYRFIGRRQDKAEILGTLFEKVPILLKGQGGVGKTAMAEHLVQRLIAKEPKTVPFLFDESTRSIKEILDTLQNSLIHQGHKNVIANVNQYEKAMDKFQYLLFQVKEAHQPVFVFDNLESFQKEPGEDFAEEYTDIKEVIAYLCERQIYHVILTCRYPVMGFKDLRSFDLNQVGFNDFWKKCLYMDVGDIHIHLREKASFEKAREGFLARPGLKYIDVVKLLHDTFGGNYRALEFFDCLVKENPDKIIDSLDSLEEFRESSRKTTDQVKQQMEKSLLFSQLMKLLKLEQQRVLELIPHFRVPVQVFALQLQIKEQQQTKDVNWSKVLERLHRLTLIEISMNREIQAAYYYVTPIVKELLADYKKEEDQYHFSHEKAGIYYYHIFYNIEESITPLEEAFYHFDQSGNKDRIQEIGDWLSNFYYNYSMYRNAYFYAQRVYELFGEDSKSSILNCLGKIYYFYGDYEKSLDLYKKALAGYQKKGDKQGEGEMLNNISQIYNIRGDYDTALKYLEKDLKICQDLGNKSEGITLSNIGEIYRLRGAFDTAREYLEQSLKIKKEIGNKSGEVTILNSISLIYSARGDYDSALKFLEESLKISQEIGGKSGEGTTLNNISQIYKACNDYPTALKYLNQCLKIFQEIGDKSKEGITLNNISGIYQARSDYETALKYLEQSLKIQQEIGDKSGSIPTLHNIAGIAFLKQDIKKFMEYENTAYKIAVETNNAMGIYNVGRDLGYEMAQQGMKKEGIALLKRSIEIGKAAGFPNVGEIEDILKEIGEL
jgi:tetratricopeptide (TPR) repeat protein